jgi:hypothetical protein
MTVPGCECWVLGAGCSDGRPIVERFSRPARDRRQQTDLETRTKAVRSRPGDLTVRFSFAYRVNVTLAPCVWPPGPIAVTVAT